MIYKDLIEKGLLKEEEINFSQVVLLFTL